MSETSEEHTLNHDHSDSPASGSGPQEGGSGRDQKLPSSGQGPEQKPGQTDTTEQRPEKTGHALENPNAGSKPTGPNGTDRGSLSGGDNKSSGDNTSSGDPLSKAATAAGNRLTDAYNEGKKVVGEKVAGAVQSVKTTVENVKNTVVQSVQNADRQNQAGAQEIKNTVGRVGNEAKGVAQDVGKAAWNSSGIGQLSNAGARLYDKGTVTSGKELAGNVDKQFGGGIGGGIASGVRDKADGASTTDAVTTGLDNATKGGAFSEPAQHLDNAVTAVQKGDYVHGWGEAERGTATFVRDAVNTGLLMAGGEGGGGGGEAPDAKAPETKAPETAPDAKAPDADAVDPHAPTEPAIKAAPPVDAASPSAAPDTVDPTAPTERAPDTPPASAAPDTAPPSAAPDTVDPSAPTERAPDTPPASAAPDTAPPSAAPDTVDPSAPTERAPDTLRSPDTTPPSAAPDTAPPSAAPDTVDPGAPTERVPDTTPGEPPPGEGDVSPAAESVPPDRSPAAESVQPDRSPAAESVPLDRAPADGDPNALGPNGHDRPSLSNGPESAPPASPGDPQLRENFMRDNTLSPSGFDAARTEWNDLVAKGKAFDANGNPTPEYKALSEKLENHNIAISERLTDLQGKGDFSSAEFKELRQERLDYISDKGNHIKMQDGVRHEAWANDLRAGRIQIN